jgi:predicted ester cyclase
MGAEENKALVRRFLTALTEGNLNVIDELVGSDFVDRSLLPGQGPTREDFKRSVAQILAAFSVTSFTIDEQIAEGDRVVTKYRERSIIKGEFAGLPPTLAYLLPERRKTSKASTSTAFLRARSWRNGARRTRYTRRWNVSSERREGESASSTVAAEETGSPPGSPFVPPGYAAN